MKQPSIHMHDQKAALLRVGKRKTAALIDQLLLTMAFWGLGLLITIS